MTMTRLRDAASLLACLILATGVAGCRIHVDKGANGEDKNVRIDTPFGGIHVNSDETTAADLGLPTYPGAQEVRGDDKHKSADVHMGFGEWELRVRVVSYETTDGQDKVVAFYKQALSRYGDVITCKDKAPVGKPTETSEGLTCADDGHHGNVQVDTGDYKSGMGNLELKAGSERHQHIVGFESPQNGQTRFALVALDLPAGVEGDKSDKSN
jgi:hypothetical protein